MKILVCGNGPSLLRHLKDKSLTGFFVVRVNNWQPIKGYDNRCDAWVMYPLNHIGEAESRYDLVEWSKYTREIWLAHSWAIDQFFTIFGKVPDYTLPMKTFLRILNQSKTYAPTTGIFAIHMALSISDNVWVAGFDLYTEGSYYYNTSLPSPTGGRVHNHEADHTWLKSMLKSGVIKQF